MCYIHNYFIIPAQKKMGNWVVGSSVSRHKYRGADKSLARPTSRYILFDGENISFKLIYLLTAIGLSPGGSSTVHIYTQTVHRTTQNKQYIEQHNNLGECGPCTVLASYTLAFALQLGKKQGKPSVRVAASKNTWILVLLYIYIVLIFLQL